MAKRAVQPFVHVGAHKDTIQEARAAINDILASPACDAAKTAALEALSSLCATNGTSFTNCMFDNTKSS